LYGTHDYLLPVYYSKRERPDSNWELLKSEAAPQQKTRAQMDSLTNGLDNDDGEVDENDDADDDGDCEGDDDSAQSPTNTDTSSTVDSNADASAPSSKRWTKAQDAALRESVRLHGEKNWKAIAERVPGRNHAQCLQRWRKVLKPGLVKGHWSFEEDKILEVLVKQSCNNWGQIAEQIPGRTPKQCRERWRNHLDPSINKGGYMFCCLLHQPDLNMYPL